MENWGEQMLNYDAVVCRFADIITHLGTFSDQVFLRPSADSKFFAGATMAASEIVDWWRKVKSLDESHLCDPHNLNMDTLIVLSRPKTILKEYRTWIVGRRVVAASLYRFGGNVHYDHIVEERVLEYATERADEWSPVRAFVLDVAETEEGLKIVEINTLNSAGFYAANVGKLVDAIEAMEPFIALTASHS